MYDVTLDRPVALRMDEVQLRLIDDWASEQGVSRSEMVRRLLTVIIARIHNKELGRNPLADPGFVMIDKSELQRVTGWITAIERVRAVLGPDVTETLDRTAKLSEALLALADALGPSQRGELT